MKSSPINPSKDMESFKAVVESAFSETPDDSLDEWLSFSYMQLMMEQGLGYGLKAETKSGEENIYFY